MDRILVVEDDRELNQGICFALQQGMRQKVPTPFRRQSLRVCSRNIRL